MIVVAAQSVPDRRRAGPRISYHGRDMTVSPSTPFRYAGYDINERQGTVTARYQLGEVIFEEQVRVPGSGACLYVYVCLAHAHAGWEDRDVP